MFLHSKNAAKHDMYSRMGCGCSYMPIMGIHGSGWVRGNIIEVWGAERRQSEPRMTVVSRCVHARTIKPNKQNTRFGEEGQGRSVGSRV